MEPSPYVQVDDYEPVARSKVPEDLWDFYAGGAGDERTLADNVRAFDRWILRPRVLRGVSAPDTATTLLGSALAAPVLVAPWAFQRRAHPDGELAVVRAAGRVGTIAVISSTAADRVDEIASAATGPVWWQLYLYADIGRSAELLRRVTDAGYGAICWTVDLPVLGLRHRDTRRGFEPPVPVGVEDHAYEPSLTWEHLSFIRDHAPGLPVIVKGILTGEDAEIAVDRGVDAIVVSNHGGRQLDSVAAGLDALPEVVDAVGGRIPVLMDGGVRRGTDVLKALALGSAAVLVGRPTIWGLAAEGEEGVVGVLEILRLELENAMALTGCRTLAEVGRDLVGPHPGVTGPNTV